MSARMPFPSLLPRLLLVVIGIGCGVLVIGTPAGVLWATSKLTDKAATHFGLAFVCMPPAILLVALPLAYLNRLYVEITGTGAPPGTRAQRVRGPLEPMLVIVGVLVVIALFLWLVTPLGHAPPDPYPFG